MVVANNQDTKIHWKKKVGTIVLSGEWLKLTDILAYILLDEKYYLNQTSKLGSNANWRRSLLLLSFKITFVTSLLSLFNSTGYMGVAPIGLVMALPIIC